MHRFHGSYFDKAKSEIGKFVENFGALIKSGRKTDPVFKDELVPDQLLIRSFVIVAYPGANERQATIALQSGQ